MKPKPPKPANKLHFLKALETYESKSDDVLLPSKAFKEHVEAIWDLKDLSEKEMLALVQHLKSKRQGAFVVAI